MKRVHEIACSGAGFSSSTCPGRWSTPDSVEWGLRPTSLEMGRSIRSTEPRDAVPGQSPDWMSQSRYGDDLWAPRSEVIERLRARFRGFPLARWHVPTRPFTRLMEHVEYEAVGPAHRTEENGNMGPVPAGQWVSTVAVGRRRPGAARHARTATTAAATAATAGPHGLLTRDTALASVTSTCLYK